MSSSVRSELEWLCKGLKKKKFQTKMNMVGEDDDDMAKVNRIVRWHPEKGITCEADPRHAEIIIRDTEQRISRPSQHGLRRKRRETEDEKRQVLNGRRLSGVQQ